MEKQMILILAGDYREACQKIGGRLPVTVDGVKYHYLSDECAIRGLDNFKIARVGMWRRRRDIRDLMRVLRCLRQIGRFEYVNL